jgi:hypothetical protein
MLEDSRSSLKITMPLYRSMSPNENGKPSLIAAQPQVQIEPDQSERRRHTRYRLTEPIVIRREGGSSARAITSEISISGLSAVTALVLAVGEKVTLSPVVGASITAIVRRAAGTIYGFEFIDPPDKVVEDIHALCRGLFAFRGAKEHAN